jgi:hypothetical protein
MSDASSPRRSVAVEERVQDSNWAIATCRTPSGSQRRARRVQGFLEELVEDILKELAALDRAKLGCHAKMVAQIMLAVRNYVREQTDIDKPFAEWTVLDIIGVVMRVGNRT